MAGRLLLLFIFLPLIELLVWIQVGSMIGLGWSVVIIVGTAIIGSQLVRRQGLDVYRRVQEQQRRGEVPAIAMLEGLALLLAGLFLILPGLITGAIGFLLLIPPLRQWVARRLLSRAVTLRPGTAYGPHQGTRSGHDGSVIEGDYERRDDSD